MAIASRDAIDTVSGLVMKMHMNPRGHRVHRADLSVLLCVLFIVCGESSSVFAQPPVVGRPPDFSGAIGGPFVVTIGVEGLTQVEVPIEEPFTLTLRIVGPGNLKEIARPALAKLGAFKLFTIDDLDDAFADGSPPSRTFRYRLRTRTAGTIEIPPFKFVYFNPAIVPSSRGYQTTYSNGLKVDAEFEGARPTNYALPLMIASELSALGVRPDDDEAIAGLISAREFVRYSSADLRPTQSWWPYWLTLRRYRGSALGLCLLGVLAVTRFLNVRRRAWVIACLD